MIKEFACELSVPVTAIFNSFRTGIVLQTWKGAVVAPIPKEQPAMITKIRPISLTSQLAKIAEGFVYNWLLADFTTNIDRSQFGSPCGSSTTHC